MNQLTELERIQVYNLPGMNHQVMRALKYAVACEAGAHFNKDDAKFLLSQIEYLAARNFQLEAILKIGTNGETK